jgi:transposase, IS5 family
VGEQIAMRQQSLASQGSFEKYGRKSRRELFLDEMNQVVPWAELEARVIQMLAVGVAL